MHIFKFLFSSCSISLLYCTENLKGCGILLGCRELLEIFCVGKWHVQVNLILQTNITMKIVKFGLDIKTMSMKMRK